MCSFSGKFSEAQGMKLPSQGNKLWQNHTGWTHFHSAGAGCSEVGLSNTVRRPGALCTYHPGHTPRLQGPCAQRRPDRNQLLSSRSHCIRRQRQRESRLHNGQPLPATLRSCWQRRPPQNSLNHVNWQLASGGPLSAICSRAAKRWGAFPRGPLLRDPPLGPAL